MEIVSRGSGRLCYLRSDHFPTGFDASLPQEPPVAQLCSVPGSLRMCGSEDGQLDFVYRPLAELHNKQPQWRRDDNADRYVRFDGAFPEEVGIFMPK